MIIFSSFRIMFDSATAGDPIDTILTAETYFPLADFPSGIVHFSVFNEVDGRVLAERLIYYHAPNILIMFPFNHNRFSCECKK